MVSACPLISMLFSPFINHLVTVLTAPITIGIIVTFVFHSFFQFPSKDQVFIPLLAFFQFYSVVSRDSKIHNFASSFFCFLFFLLTIIRSDLLAEIRWFVCMPKSHRSLCVSFSRTDAGLCIYHLFVWSNSNFFSKSQWITLPTQFSLVQYSLWANLLHSLIRWLMVSLLSPHNLHLLFCRVLSIFALIWLVLMGLFVLLFLLLPYTSSVLICCICLLCDWLFRLCYCIVYICYFVESCSISLWYDWFLWRCPVLLLEEIMFLF